MNIVQEQDSRLANWYKLLYSASRTCKVFLFHKAITKYTICNIMLARVSKSLTRFLLSVAERQRRLCFSFIFDFLFAHTTTAALRYAFKQIKKHRLTLNIKLCVCNFHLRIKRGCRLLGTNLL